MRNCIPEETLQAWFDGELADNEAAIVATHLTECLNCAEGARTVEAENLIVSKGLAFEFDGTIPTERLRERVVTAVAGLQHAGISTGRLSLSQRARELFSSFRPLAYASIVIAVLLGGFVVFTSWKKEQPTRTTPPEVVRSNSVKVPSSNATASNEKPPTHKPSASPEKRNDRRSIAIKRSRPDEPDAFSLAWQQRLYDYAISRLDEAIRVQPAMRPSVQVEYAYNMAVIDNAIATGRLVARRNPGDPHATQFLLDAYQSKVDLMNQIANPRVRDE
ncbi:MAG TPA: zf-HC2 domain-containing protein [Pyrinomonadaceae bacterium]|nr:zf-HC2 domain-containing protein [Pyrinomonadaceae bacterium]